ncbi:hypothetical protein V2G26_009211 [Clonostachys chloroleuca]
MAFTAPYTYIQCPCSSDHTDLDHGDQIAQDAIENDDEHTFDPRAPRSNYSLYPLEYLLYCEECQQIRCPKCVNEEIVTYFCPNCLFEVPSSNLRSEGNRCTRSCFQCPVCTSPVQAGEIPNEPDPTLLGADNNPTAHVSYALFCQYCNWSSSEIGIEFDRPSGIPAQLAKLKNGGEPKITVKDLKERRKENPNEGPVADELVDTELQFANLKSFFQGQLSDSTSVLGNLSLADGAGFSSPAALSRIMTLYTAGRGQPGRQRGPPDTMREALSTDDGLRIAKLDESAEVKKLFRGGGMKRCPGNRRWRSWSPRGFKMSSGPRSARSGRNDPSDARSAGTSYPSPRTRWLPPGSRSAWLPRTTSLPFPSDP